MHEYLTAGALLLIALCCLYLLWSQRFEERVFGHLALAASSAGGMVGAYTIVVLGQPLNCHPLIIAMLWSWGMFIGWYVYTLHRAGERRENQRRKEARLYQRHGQMSQ